MKKIILERNLDFNQFKNVFILNFICFFILLMLIKSDANPSIINLLIFTLFILVGLLLLRKGLVIEKNEQIRTAYFLFGMLLKTNIIETKKMNIVSILTFRKRSNYKYPKRWNSFNRWEPNLEYSATSYQLYLLNENHSVKRKLISFMKEESSIKALNFLLQNAEMKVAVYNPNNSKKTSY